MTTATREFRTVTSDATTDYAERVVSGEILAGKWVRAACQRHLDDLEHGHERGLHFDTEQARKTCAFFGFLRQYKGEWAGQPFELQPWQKFIIGSLFGWKRSDGTRRFRVAYNEIPRKNGKTLLAGGVGLLLAFFDKEPGAEVYAAATKRDQAKLVWNDARQMVTKSPDLKQRIQVMGGETGVGSLYRISTASKFIPLGADADSIDGLNSHGLIVDELHAHKQRAMWDVLQTSTGARRQPLTFVITTAGFDRLSVCYEQHDYGIKILENTIQDDTFFVYIACWDEEDDWTSPISWQKANPNYGISVKPDDLERKCYSAQQKPAEKNEFLRKHGCIWSEGETAWLSLDVFDANVQQVDPATLVGKPCFGGLDLSTTTDLTAFTLYFPNATEDGGSWLHYYFVPKAGVKERSERDRVPYQTWIEQGHLIATPGNVVDYSHIREQINSLRDDGFEIKEIGYDPYNATQIVTDLMSDGFTCVPIRQGFLSLSPPTKELERLLLAHKMKLGTNPVTRWAASNAVVLTDAAGNVKLDKSSRRARIDPIAAMINAVDRASRDDKTPTWSGIWLGSDDDDEGDLDVELI